MAFVRRIRLTIRFVTAFLFLACLLSARRLPIKTYTTANGLARDHILCIVQDSHGFLWFCTAEGLSRFDGYEFTNYHVEQGLPTNAVNDFLETTEGVYYVATSGGLCRFEPVSAPARFRCYTKAQVPNPVGVLYEDKTGMVWAGGGEGLLMLDRQDGLFKPSPIPIPPGVTVTNLLQDRRGMFWVGTSKGLYRRDPISHAITLFTTVDGLPDNFIMGLLEDHAGRLWIGTRVGLARRDDRAFRTFETKDGLPAKRIESLIETSDHTLWIGTTEGLAEHLPDDRFQSYSLAQGLSAHAVGPMAEDRDGNLWIGTFGSGLMKVARSGFTTYNEPDGVPFADAFVKGRDGSTYVISRGDRDTRISRFDGWAFETIRPAWPPQINDHGWGRGQIALQSANGEWWIATGRGLCRFAAGFSNGASPSRIYTAGDGLPGSGVFRVFEDSHADIWIGTIGPNNEDGLALWSRATGTIQSFHESDGLPHAPVPTGFAEERNGSIWISLFHGGVARRRPGAARFDYFDNAKLPGFMFGLLADSAGRLWIGTSRGLVRIDDPSADVPDFVTYRTAQGLSSNSIEAITEDRQGRIYLATGRGVDRFEPLPGGLGRMKHYTTADGITPGELNLAFRDNEGAIWFASALGASRFMPSPDAPRPPPPVLLTGLSTGGVAQPISDLGQTSVTGLRLPQTPLRVDFVGLDYSPGEALRYQYMLDGIDREWGPLTDQRSVVYGSLSPGSYRFLVRAVTSDGAASPVPATIAFTVLPPLWRTWWFLGLCAIGVGAFGFAFHRYRLAQLVALANVRTHIATDLHDDIGTSLSQIAVLSEVALRTQNEADESGTTPLTQIASISRELIDGMSDIVWAINPEHDRLDNLVYRMRRIATDLLGGQKIALAFRSTAADQDMKIAADARRHVYLIFKEGVHNIARHSGATSVEVALELAGGHLDLRLSDNGMGFDPDGDYEGRGLMNIRKRAAAIGAAVSWSATPGGGSTLMLSAPIGSRKPRLATLRGK